MARSQSPGIPQALLDAWGKYQSTLDRLRAERPEPDEKFHPEVPPLERTRRWVTYGHPDADAAATDLLRRFAAWHLSLYPPGIETDVRPRPCGGNPARAGGCELL